MSIDDLEQQLRTLLHDKAGGAVFSSERRFQSRSASLAVVRPLSPSWHRFAAVATVAAIGLAGLVVALTVRRANTPQEIHPTQSAPVAATNSSVPVPTPETTSSSTMPSITTPSVTTETAATTENTLVLAPSSALVLPPGWTITQEYALPTGFLGFDRTVQDWGELGPDGVSLARSIEVVVVPAEGVADSPLTWTTGLGGTEGDWVTVGRRIIIHFGGMSQDEASLYVASMQRRNPDDPLAGFTMSGLPNVVDSVGTGASIDADFVVKVELVNTNGSAGTIDVGPADGPAKHLGALMERVRIGDQIANVDRILSSKSVSWVGSGLQFSAGAETLDDAIALGEAVDAVGQDVWSRIVTLANAQAPTLPTAPPAAEPVETPVLLDPDAVVDLERTVLHTIRLADSVDTVRAPRATADGTTVLIALDHLTVLHGDASTTVALPPGSKVTGQPLLDGTSLYVPIDVGNPAPELVKLDVDDLAAGAYRPIDTDVFIPQPYDEISIAAANVIVNGTIVDHVAGSPVPTVEFTGPDGQPSSSMSVAFDGQTRRWMFDGSPSAPSFSGVWPLPDGSVVRLVTLGDDPLIARFHQDGTITSGRLATQSGVTSEMQIDDTGVILLQRSGDSLDIVRYALP